MIAKAPKTLFARPAALASTQFAALVVEALACVNIMSLVVWSIDLKGLYRHFSPICLAILPVKLEHGNHPIRFVRLLYVCYLE